MVYNLSTFCATLNSICAVTVKEIRGSLEVTSEQVSIYFIVTHSYEFSTQMFQKLSITLRLQKLCTFLSMKEIKNNSYMLHRTKQCLTMERYNLHTLFLSSLSTRSLHDGLRSKVSSSLLSFELDTLGVVMVLTVVVAVVIVAVTIAEITGVEDC